MIQNLETIQFMVSLVRTEAAIDSETTVAAAAGPRLVGGGATSQSHQEGGLLETYIYEEEWRDGYPVAYLTLLRIISTGLTG